MATRKKTIIDQSNQLPNHFFAQHSFYHHSNPIFKNPETCSNAADETYITALRVPKLMAMANEALSFDKGYFKFDKEDALAAGISYQDFSVMDASVCVTNNLIGQGSLKLNANLQITPAIALFAKTTLIDVSINGQRYVLEYEVTWLGNRYYISKALVNKISQLIALGAGAAGIAAALQAAGIITAPSAAITGIIAAILAFGAAALQFLDFCNGVYILLPFGGMPPVIVYPA